MAREMAIKRTIVPVFKIEPLLRVDVDHDGRSRIFRQLTVRLTRNGVREASMKWYEWCAKQFWFTQDWQLRLDGWTFSSTVKKITIVDRRFIDKLQQYIPILDSIKSKNLNCA